MSTWLNIHRCRHMIGWLFVLMRSWTADPNTIQYNLKCQKRAITSPSHPIRFYFVTSWFKRNILFCQNITENKFAYSFITCHRKLIFLILNAGGRFRDTTSAFGQWYHSSNASSLSESYRELKYNLLSVFGLASWDELELSLFLQMHLRNKLSQWKRVK